jgi:hypothetical protein
MHSRFAESKRLWATIGLATFAVIVVTAIDLRTSIGHGATVQSKWDLPELQQAIDAGNHRNCREQWNILWPLAKQGNSEARYLLWAGMTGDLRPPGPTSQSIRTRQLLTFSVYATMAARGPSPLQGDQDHRWAHSDIPIFIKELALGPKGDRVAQCYKSKSPFHTCLNLAVSLGVVQEFEDFADELDVSGQQEHETASCRPHAF